MSTDLVPAEPRAVAPVAGPDLFKDYVTPAAFVAYGADGEILTAGQQGVAFITDAMARGERILFAEIPWNHGLVDLAHYVDVAGRQVREKTACPATRAGLTLSDLPVPCRIEIDNPVAPPSVYPWSDRELVLSFDHPGSYTVRVLSVPHLPATFTVTVDD